MEQLSHTKLQLSIDAKIRFSRDNLLFAATENDCLVINQVDTCQPIFHLKLKKKVLAFDFADLSKKIFLIVYEDSLLLVKLSDFSQTEEKLPVSIKEAGFDALKSFLFLESCDESLELPIESISLDLLATIKCIKKRTRPREVKISEDSYSVNLVEGKSKQVFHSDSKITCIASNSEFIALGLENGKILALNPRTGEKNRKHWHSGVVTAICISNFSKTIYSGGHEGVLVAWRFLEDKLDFFPRLGASFSTIACSENGQLLGITLSNQHLLVIHSQSFRRLWEFRGLEISHSICPKSQISLQKEYFVIRKANGAFDFCFPQIDGSVSIRALSPGDSSLHSPSKFIHQLFSLTLDGSFGAFVETLWEGPPTASRLRFYTVSPREGFTLNNKIANPFGGAKALLLHSGFDCDKEENFFVSLDELHLRWWAMRTAGGENEWRFVQTNSAEISIQGKPYMSGNFLLFKSSNEISCFDLTGRRVTQCFQRKLSGSIDQLSITGESLAISSSGRVIIMRIADGSIQDELSLAADIAFQPLPANALMVIARGKDTSNVLLCREGSVERTWSLPGSICIAWLGPEGRIMLASLEGELYKGGVNLSSPLAAPFIPVQEELNQKVSRQTWKIPAKHRTQQLQNAIVFPEQSHLLPPSSTTFNILFEELLK